MIDSPHETTQKSTIFSSLKTTKTYQLLATLTAWEHRAFEAMLESAYWNRNTPVKALYHALLPTLRDPHLPELTPEAAFEAIFPGQPFQHPRLRYVLTDLAQLIEDFWVHKALEQDRATRTRLLLRAYRLRGLDKYFLQTQRAALDTLSRDKIRDAAHLLERFFIEEAGLEHAQATQNRAPEDGLRPMIESLEGFSLVTRLKYLCELLNRSNVVSSDTDDRLLASVRDELELGHHTDYPAIAIYKTILYTLIESAQPTHYDQLRISLRTHASAIPLTELGQMYAFALNYCIKRLNEGEIHYLRELHSLYQELIAGKILHEHGILAPQHFKNIVTVAIRLEEYTWTEQFIEQHKADLPDTERENAYVYNMACLHYARRNFSATKRLLQQVVFTDPYYQLDSRAILLKCYYETDDHEPLISLIHSFRLYLRRNTAISEYQRKVYLNMLKYLEKLEKARLDDRNTVPAIITELSTSLQVADLAWLRRKAQELA